MKSLKKILAIFALCGSLIGNARASNEAMYMPHVQDLTVQTHALGVSVVNVSYDAWDDFYPVYKVYATYLPTYAISVMDLGPFGSPTDSIFYSLSYPNTTICFRIDTTGLFPYTIYQTCTSSGTIYVYGDDYFKKEKTGPHKMQVKLIK